MFFIFCCFIAAVILSFLMTPTEPKEPLCCDLYVPGEPDEVSEDALAFWSYEDTLQAKTLADLKGIAKAKGLKGVSKMRKSELVTAIAA